MEHVNGTKRKEQIGTPSSNETKWDTVTAQYHALGAKAPFCKTEAHHILGTCPRHMTGKRLATKPRHTTLLAHALRTRPRRMTGKRLTAKQKHTILLAHTLRTGPRHMTGKRPAANRGASPPPAHVT